MWPVAIRCAVVPELSAGIGERVVAAGGRIGGVITYEAGKSLLNQKMQVRVNMGVMGQAENVLARAKSSLLSGERDDLGYMKLREPFVIGGTAGKPDPGQLYVMLGRSLLDILLH